VEQDAERRQVHRKRLQVSHQFGLVQGRGAEQRVPAVAAPVPGHASGADRFHGDAAPAVARQRGGGGPPGRDGPVAVPVDVLPPVDAGDGPRLRAGIAVKRGADERPVRRVGAPRRPGQERPGGVQRRMSHQGRIGKRPPHPVQPGGIGQTVGLGGQSVGGRAGIRFRNGHSQTLREGPRQEQGEIDGVPAGLQQLPEDLQDPGGIPVGGIRLVGAPPPRGRVGQGAGTGRRRQAEESRFRHRHQGQPRRFGAGQGVAHQQAAGGGMVAAGKFPADEGEQVLAVLDLQAAEMVRSQVRALPAPRCGDEAVDRRYGLGICGKARVQDPLVGRMGGHGGAEAHEVLVVDLDDPVGDAADVRTGGAEAGEAR